MAQEKKAARELLEMANKHFEDYSLIGAVEHVYHMARDRGLAWAMHEVLELAEDAIDRARIDWQRSAKHEWRGFRSGRQEIEAAQADGFDLIGTVRGLLGD